MVKKPAPVVCQCIGVAVLLEFLWTEDRWRNIAFIMRMAILVSTCSGMTA